MKTFMQRLGVLVAGVAIVAAGAWIGPTNLLAKDHDNSIMDYVMAVVGGVIMAGGIAFGFVLAVFGAHEAWLWMLEGVQIDREIAEKKQITEHVAGGVSIPPQDGGELSVSKEEEDSG